jgi:type II secretory pathway pseudopilin PulG
MKTGPRAEGFTVVETLIVVAVMGAMLLMAALFINGRQAKTEFQQGVRTMQQQIQQVMSDVASGYYPNNDAISCTQVGSNPQVRTTTPQEQGTNQDCMFVGRVIQFDVGPADPQEYNIYSIAGLRTAVSGTGLNLADVSPIVIASSNGDPDTPDLFDNKVMPFGLKVDRVVSTDASGASTDIGSIGFTSNLSSLDASDKNQRVDVLPIPNTQLGKPQSSEVNKINSKLPSATANPAKGIVVCISGGSGQFATLNIGGEGRQLSVSSTITSTAACP